MGKLRDLKIKSNKKANNKARKNQRRPWKIVVIAIYITFLLLSSIPFIAEKVTEPQMQDSYEYHLEYYSDGRQSHYYIERMNTSSIGQIDLVYTTESNSLLVETKNIKVLHIYCRSMYADECMKVYGIDPNHNSNYYKWYFIEKNHLNVNIITDTKIQDLSFYDTPIPYKVVVNGIRWYEGTDYLYSENSGLVLGYVPAGQTAVDIYFKSDSNTGPTAVLKTSRTLVSVNDTIIFDASRSFDADGELEAITIDFGDGTFNSDEKCTHQYSEPGKYGVILTVRDEEYLIAHAYVTIQVVESTDIPMLLGRVPDQIRPEDAPAWTLNLAPYRSQPENKNIEYNFYLTGENTSLYTVTGENSTNDQLIFTPLPDASGSDLVTLMLTSTENLTVTQPLWINITPVNDPPSLRELPNLNMHYGLPYTFDFTPYVNDKDTPRDIMVLSIDDGCEENYINIIQLKAIFNYPKKMFGEILYATVTVDDGEATAQDTISIQVTDNHAPVLLKPLPDITLYQETAKYNIFDLDDYFTDQDGELLYFSSSKSQLDISINPNHTVDIAAYTEWSGSEHVRFDARDPLGAIAEGYIILTVLEVNSPPVIEVLPNLKIRYGYDYCFNVAPYIHDIDNTTGELTITLSDPENIRIDEYNNMIIILNYPRDYLDKTITVLITVFDGLNSMSRFMNVTITYNFPPEFVSHLPDVVFLEDMSLRNAFDLDNYFLDIENNSQISYFAINNSLFVKLNEDNTVDFSAPTNWFGNELVRFRATDTEGAFKETTITATVLPENDGPIFLSIPKQFCRENERWVLDLADYIVDVDNDLSELEITEQYESIIVTGTTLIFLPQKSIPRYVEVEVSDGKLCSSCLIEIKMVHDGQPAEYGYWVMFTNILLLIIAIDLIILAIFIIIQHKRNKFIVKEIFLIHKGGLLITHLSRQTQANVDDVIFSGMFTAVQDFIKDTFTQDDDRGENTTTDEWTLDELKLGDNKILIERSTNVYLAVIFSGKSSTRLRKIVSRLIEKIENEYGTILRKWDGNIDKLAGTKNILNILIIPISKSDKGYEGDNGYLGNDDNGENILNPTLPRSITSTKNIHELNESGEPLKLSDMNYMRLNQPPEERKTLLECTSDQTGADKPGLTAWALKKISDKLPGLPLVSPKLSVPMALQINPICHQPKTLEVKIPKTNKPKSKLSSKVRRQMPISPSLKGNDKSEKTVIISRGEGKKVFKLDPTRSLLRQLAEMDDGK
ncbi:PKD domain-containing protein [[Eubacterium] cellulosolvens]